MKEQKEKYQEIEIEIIRLMNEDVITTSDVDDVDYD